MVLIQSALLEKFSWKKLLFMWPLCINMEVTFSMFTDVRCWLAKAFVILNKYSILGHIFNRNSCTENLLKCCNCNFFQNIIKTWFQKYLPTEKIYVYGNSIHNIIILRQVTYFAPRTNVCYSNTLLDQALPLSKHSIMLSWLHLWCHMNNKFFCEFFLVMLTVINRVSRSWFFGGVFVFVFLSFLSFFFSISNLFIHFSWRLRLPWIFTKILKKIQWFFEKKIFWKNPKLFSKIVSQNQQILAKTWF